jgi:hypothetical protein
MPHPVLEAIRQNHALEHATIALLLYRLGPQQLVGWSSYRGFFLIGRLPDEMVAACAQDALSRLQNGEVELAISPQCGTNLAVSGVLAGLAAVLALGNRRRSEALAEAILASTVAVTASQWLGPALQRYVTTSPNLQGVAISAISARSIGPLTIHEVRTVR